MSTFVKKNTKRVGYIFIVIGGAILAFFGFNSGDTKGNLSTGDVADFFVEEALADGGGDGGDGWWGDGGGGDEGGDEEGT